MRKFLLAAMTICLAGMAFGDDPGTWCNIARNAGFVTCKDSCETPTVTQSVSNPGLWYCWTYVSGRSSFDGTADTNRVDVYENDASKIDAFKAWCPTMCSCWHSCSAQVAAYKTPCHESYCTPMVIALGNTFQFTAPETGVLFDLDGDGDLESTSWAAGDRGTALLYLDRNGNGVVDDGRELFGGATAQPASEEPPNGYAALRVFDAPAGGGDGDGYLSPSDAIFSQLGLWLDRNGDGISQPAERTTLAAEGIQLIDLYPVVSNRRDEYGNALRWTSHVRFARGWRPAGGDVIFVPTP